jgi:hypothetical protein
MFTTSVAKKEKQQMDEIYSRRPYLVDLLAAAVCQSVFCLLSLSLSLSIYLSIQVLSEQFAEQSASTGIKETSSSSKDSKQTRTAKPFAV